jgi:DNA replication and repair protein RecF
VYIAVVHLRSFRNYEDLKIEPSAGLTILVGPNAAGKTNVIEGIQICTSGRSFRRPRWDEVVSWGASAAGLSVTAWDDRTEVVLDSTITTEGTRTFRVNGVRKMRMSDFQGIIPSVVFTPDDLTLAKGPAEVRRNDIDDLGEQLSKAYGVIRRDYQRVLRHRNVLLREWRAGDSDLEPWDDLLVTLGAKLFIHRRGLARRLVERAEPVYRDLAGGEELDVTYLDRCGVGLTSVREEVTQTAVEEALRVELANRRADERVRLATLVGPHRDDIGFVIGGREARTYASQGQQRTVALAWKLAEVSVVEDVLGRKPVLLLDDVMSELDAARRRALTDLVRDDVQTIVTTTNTGYFDEETLRTATIVRINLPEED